MVVDRRADDVVLQNDVTPWSEGKPPRRCARIVDDGMI